MVIRRARCGLLVNHSRHHYPNIIICSNTPNTLRSNRRIPNSLPFTPLLNFTILKAVVPCMVLPCSNTRPWEPCLVKAMLIWVVTRTNQVRLHSSLCIRVRPHSNPACKDGLLVLQDHSKDGRTFERVRLCKPPPASIAVRTFISPLPRARPRTTKLSHHNKQGSEEPKKNPKGGLWRCAAYLSKTYSGRTRSLYQFFTISFSCLSSSYPVHYAWHLALLCFHHPFHSQ